MHTEEVVVFVFLLFCCGFGREELCAFSRALLLWFFVAFSVWCFFLFRLIVGGSQQQKKRRREEERMQDLIASLLFVLVLLVVSFVAAKVFWQTPFDVGESHFRLVRSEKEKQTNCFR